MKNKTNTNTSKKTKITKRARSPFSFKMAMLSINIFLLLGFVWLLSATFLQSVANGYSVRTQRNLRDAAAAEREIENFNILIARKTTQEELHEFATKRGMSFDNNRVHVIRPEGQ